MVYFVLILLSTLDLSLPFYAHTTTTLDPTFDDIWTWNGPN